MAEYSFLSSDCSGCGKSLAKAKAELAGMKGEMADGQGIPMGYCPKCGVANPLTSASAPEPPEPPEPTGEGTGEGEGEAEGEGTGEGED